MIVRLNEMMFFRNTSLQTFRCIKEMRLPIFELIKQIVKMKTTKPGSRPVY